MAAVSRGVGSTAGQGLMVSGRILALTVGGHLVTVICEAGQQAGQHTVRMTGAVSGSGTGQAIRVYRGTYLIPYADLWKYAIRHARRTVREMQTGAHTHDRIISSRLPYSVSLYGGQDYREEVEMMVRYGVFDRVNKGTGLLARLSEQAGKEWLGQ